MTAASPAEALVFWGASAAGEEGGGGDGSPRCSAAKWGRVIEPELEMGMSVLFHTHRCPLHVRYYELYCLTRRACSCRKACRHEHMRRVTLGGPHNKSHFVREFLLEMKRVFATNSKPYKNSELQSQS